MTRGGRRTALTVASAALGVVVVVGGVVGVRTFDPSDGPSQPEATALAPAGSVEALPLSSITVFAGPASPDVSRTVDHDPASGWAVAECDTPARPTANPTDFVTGTETGPEYAREAQVGIFVAGGAAAAAAALRSTITSCGDAAATVTVDDATLVSAADSVVLTLTGAPNGGWAARSTYTITVLGTAVVLTGDHASTAVGDVPPSDGTSAAATEITHLAGELCRLAVLTCAE